MSLSVVKLTVGALSENCYILDLGKGKGAVVDPGDEGERIASRLEEMGLKLTAILLTHGHFDHIGAVDYLKKRYGASVYIGKDDEIMLGDKEKSGARIAPFVSFNPTSADVLLEEDSEIELGGVKLKVMATPGHSKGSVCFIGDGVIFAGDTVFKGSVGRTDLYSGNMREQGESIRRLKGIEGNYKLYCGHGEDSTLDFEKSYNPYFNI